LLPSVAAEMEAAFGCEVIPTYGMTEAMPICSHQRGFQVKIASVGPAAGLEVRVDLHGEVCVRGNNVTAGYELRSHMDENPNSWAFDEEGWFHTGDCGFLDVDGYLTISGRKKEIIVRGGEKISPFEIEDAIRDPRVQEAVAFAAPHEELGEVVALGVKANTVPDSELSALLHELRTQCSKQALPAKWLPEVLVKVSELPKGPSGKLMRIGLANRLSLPTRSAASSAVGAQAFAYCNGKLLEVESSRSGGLQDEVSSFDSLGGLRVESKKEAQERELVLAMYAVSMFGVVAEHTAEGLRLTPFMSSFGMAAVEMLTLNPNISSYWSLTAFVAGSAHIYARSPFQWRRLIVFFGVYTLINFMATWALWIHPIISGPPAEGTAYFEEPIRGVYLRFSGNKDHRYFLLILMSCYSLFGLCKHLPCPSLQCATLLVLTVCLCYADHHIQWWNPPLLASNGFTPGHGWNLWSWWFTVYFSVGHYSSDVVEAIRSHPLAASVAVQRVVALTSPILLLGFLAPFFFTMKPILDSNPDPHDEHHWMVTHWYCLKTNQQKPENIVLDMACSVVLVGLLALAVQNVAKHISRVGACALGSFIAHRFFGTVTTCGKPVVNRYWAWDSDRCYSIGIRLFGFTVVPPLQTALEWAQGSTSLQIVFFGAYVVMTILVIGLPVQLCITACAMSAQTAAGFLRHLRATRDCITRQDPEESSDSDSSHDSDCSHALLPR